MIAYGFYITQLTLIGSGLQNASIELRDGLNVVTGPSDTGKTFIAQCIDFMFGASEPPESIPESDGYEQISLSLVSRSDKRAFTLSRSLRGGSIVLQEAEREEIILNEKHDPNKEDTISHFLLSLSGLSGKLLRRNAAGKTRQVSFRDVAPLVVVDEETIIAKKSPLLTGQYTTKTIEKNLFRLLLTGIDDSSVVESPDRRIEKRIESGKSEVIEKVRESLTVRIKSIGLEGTTELLRDQLGKTDNYLKDLSAQLVARQETATSFEISRRQTWAELRRLESRLAVIEQLQSRFLLLDQQYSSDLKRLESIADVGFRLDQLKESRCPVCGAQPEHHATDFHSIDASPSTVAAASKAEAERTRLLKADLVSAIAENVQESAELRVNIASKQNNLKLIGEQLEKEAKPRLQELVNEISEGQNRRSALLRVIELHEQIVELDQFSNGEISDPTGATATANPTVTTGESEQFCKEVESLLRSWKFPKLDRVVFSEDDQDIVISGRKRAGHGKGVRAITHSAFNIGLADYCINRSLPHPSTVIIDSPLVVYREPDDDEGGFSTEVKDMFYRSLAAREQKVQIVILENDLPPDDVEKLANVIKFTGGVAGRSGFIPPRNKP